MNCDETSAVSCAPCAPIASSASPRSGTGTRSARPDPDHLAAGEATVCAFYPDARNPFAHPELLGEGLEPHTVRELWICAHPEPNRAVDVTDFFDRKIAALRSHVSQVGEGEWLADRVGGWLEAGASRAGLPPGHLAELFRVVTAP